MKHEGILIQKVVSSFVDLFLENLVVDMNDLEMIREGLMLFTYLLVDKLEDNEDDIMKILAHHCFVIDDVMPLICSICDKELSDNIFKENTTAFLEQVSKYKAEVIKLSLHILPSSCCNFPRTNGWGFIDSLLKNLKVILECKAYLIPFEKHQIARIHEELTSIRPFLKQIFELQEKHEEFKNLWTQIVNVAYYVEQVCDSCLCFDATTWHNMICLWNVVEEIEMIKTEVKEIRGNQMHNSVVMNDQIKSINMFSVKTKTPTMYEIVVGYADEATTIVDRLTRGSKQLDIVSIVGMPGLGKTTLARKGYNDPSVRFHFNKLAWCCTTQVYNLKELILDILRDVVSNENLHDINEHKLAERLRRCLKGTRYLIVMDDIWDVSPWHQLKESFPDDNNGSRIMFTSRIHKVASEAKNGCIPHHLRTFSHEESMELLQKKLSIEEDFPPELSKLRKQIAKDCKGLPLAVVLIAGLLAKKGLHLEGWKEIAETLGRNISTEGCISLLELSYKHLPEFLKPCFLYFGAFQEGQVVQAKKLIQLWIAEGFILKNDPMKSLEDVAHEYLADLICRSLVILGNRSSNGRIKDCRVHDLLHSFCLAKAKEERFLHFPSDCHFPLEIYRVRIHPKLLITSVESTYANQYVHSLLFKGKEEEHTFASSFLLRFKLLKVLDMENMKLQDSDFLEQITSLVHLRYLALSLVLIDDLPSSIENLWRLEVLVVKSPYHGIRIPHTFWKMKSLRHVYVNRGAFTYPYKSFQLNNLETHKLIDCLNYRTLLRKLPNVRKLGIILSSDYDDIPFLSIPSKLEALELHKIEYTDLEFEVPLGDDNDDDDDDLDSSIYKVLSETDLGFEPSSTSKRLHKVQDSNLQFEFLSSLKKLSLLHIRLSKKLLSAIGKLPNLEVLKLLSAVFEGGRWDVKYDEFLRLQFLKLSSSNISKWDAVTDDTFPCLERLVMKYCHLLQEIPSCFGEISTFKRIEVHWCSKKVVTSAMQILKEQQDMGNDSFQVHILNS